MEWADWIWPLLMMVAVGVVCEEFGYARGRAEACRFFMRVSPRQKTADFDEIR